MYRNNRIKGFIFDNKEFIFDGDKLTIYEKSDNSATNTEVNFTPRLESRPVFLRNIALNLTNSCNLFCKYCYAKQGDYDNPGQVMSFETAKMGVDIVALSVKKNQSDKATIAFFGGEPLLKFDTIKKVVGYASGVFPNTTNIQYLVTTNGTLLNDEMVELMSKNNFIVTLSIDDDERTHNKYRVYRLHGQGSYHDVIRSIGLLKNRVPLIGRITVAEETPDIFRSVIAVRNAGIDRITFALDYNVSDNAFQKALYSLRQLAISYTESIKSGQYYDITNFTEPIAAIALKRKKRSHCNAGLSYLSLSADGIVYRCPRFTGLKEFSFGKIKTINLSTIDSAIANYNSNLGNSASDRTSACSGCLYSYLCGGICSHHAYIKEGTQFAHIPRECEYRQLLYSLVIEILCRLSTKERREYLLYLSKFWSKKEVITNERA